jgi:hypothetical protein
MHLESDRQVVVFLHDIFSLLKSRGRTECQLPQEQALILDLFNAVEFHHRNRKIQIT